LKGAEFLESAAEQGRPDAMVIIGNAYWTGFRDVYEDILQAKYWLQRAATQKRTTAWDSGYRDEEIMGQEIARAKARLVSISKEMGSGGDGGDDDGDGDGVNQKSFSQHVWERWEMEARGHDDEEEEDEDEETLTQPGRAKEKEKGDSDSAAEILGHEEEGGEE